LLRLKYSTWRNRFSASPFVLYGPPKFFFPFSDSTLYPPFTFLIIFAASLADFARGALDVNEASIVDTDIMDTGPRQAESGARGMEAMTAVKYLRESLGSPFSVTGALLGRTETDFAEVIMLRWALGFFVVALIAAILGFGGVAVAAAGIAKIIFYIFVALFLISLISHLASRT
jgi:uncharacterized membrane protein YtjA (UPF0391 family)